mmetsp:Transcript_31661/g.48429  ORF Transcript_31661/g.48429 Transcript_31661/m.48429 type:complete len:218 (+) Transcript_31661:1182-1835(+)
MVLAIFHPPNYLERLQNNYKSKPNSKQLIEGEKLMHQSTTFLYFAIDMLSFFEISRSPDVDLRASLSEKDFHFGHTIFKKIDSLKVKSKSEITAIILESFKSSPLKAADLSRFVDILINFLELHSKSKEASQEEMEAASKHETSQLKFMKNLQGKKERMSEDRMAEFFRDYALGHISFEHYAETIVVYYVQNFRKYSRMTVKRLETGVSLLLEGSRI